MATLDIWQSHGQSVNVWKITSLSEFVTQLKFEDTQKAFNIRDLFGLLWFYYHFEIFGILLLFYVIDEFWLDEAKGEKF